MAAAHGQPERVHRAVRAFAARGPVGEAHAASLRHGFGGAGQVRVGLAAERRRAQARQDPAVGAREQLADGLLGRDVAGRTDRDEQRRELLGRERDVGEVVAVLVDRVPVLDVPGVRRDHLDRHADVAQDVLVALEHPLGGGGVLVPVPLGQLAPDLVERERRPGLEQQGDEVHQAFERVHGRGIILSAMSPDLVGRASSSRDRPERPGRASGCARARRGRGGAGRSGRTRDPGRAGAGGGVHRARGPGGTGGSRPGEHHGGRARSRARGGSTSWWRCPSRPRPSSVIPGGS